MNNSIKKKIVFSIQVELDSPLCVASGKEGLTDADVMQDYDGIRLCRLSLLREQ